MGWSVFGLHFELVLGWKGGAGGKEGAVTTIARRRVRRATGGSVRVRLGALIGTRLGVEKSAVLWKVRGAAYQSTGGIVGVETETA